MGILESYFFWGLGDKRVMEVEDWRNCTIAVVHNDLVKVCKLALNFGLKGKMPSRSMFG